MRVWMLTALLLAALPAVAQEPPSGDRLVLELSETAERTVEQDWLTSTLRIEEKGLDAADVQARVNGRMTEALKVAKRYPVVKTSTGWYSVYQNAQDSVWVAQQTLNLEGATAADVLKLTGELQRGGWMTQGLSYSLTPEKAKSLTDDLTAEAITQLKRRAEKVATQLGYRTVRLVRVSNVAPTAGGPVPFARGLRAEMMAAAAPVADAGEGRVSVTLTAEIHLLP